MPVVGEGFGVGCHQIKVTVGLLFSCLEPKEDGSFF
tara:strand:+ start:77 stop:184 length:108 start_codon:yes stop_codon:yes gene_type:complete